MKEIIQPIIVSCLRSNVTGMKMPEVKLLEPSICQMGKPMVSMDNAMEKEEEEDEPRSLSLSPSPI